jgi:hypothetical protein
LFVSYENQVQAVAKKPAMYGDSMEAQILSLAGKPDEVDDFLKNLNQQQSQEVWKKFQQGRLRDGVQQDYEKAVEGHGTQRKRKECLKAWIVGKMSCKSSEYLETHHSLGMNKKWSADAQWMTLQKALEEFGPKELKLRVASGSIQSRPSPTDKRFPEFRVVREKDSVELVRSKGMRATSGGKVSVDVFKRLNNDTADKGLELLDWDTFNIADGHEDADGDDGESLAKQYLGMKPQNKNPASGSKVSMIQKIESASVVEDKMDVSAVYTKVTIMKNEVNKLLDMITKKSFDDEHAAKKLKPSSDKLQKGIVMMSGYVKDKKTLEKVPHKQLKVNLKQIANDAKLAKKLLDTLIE